MIKSLKKLEKNLGYKIQEHIFCLAIDTATKSGIAMVTILQGKVHIKCQVLKLPKLPKELKTKTEKYQQRLSDFVNLVDKEVIPNIPFSKNSILILENSFLKMNVVTFGFLRALQGILYGKLKNKFTEVRIIFPITARKLIGFKSSLPKKSKSKDKKEEIMKWISKIVEEEICDDNIADALLLAFAGLRLED